MDKKLLEKLYSLRRFGIKPGLDRISALLKKTGNPHEKLKALHIAGTNGKGSVSSLLASILQESGYKTGLYTSPHIYSFNERVKINGKLISDNELEPLVEKYLDIGKEIEATFFEITTAIAFEYFAKKEIEICVLETGLGGLYDATNVITPLISIITKIDFDHEEYLGRTIEEITAEKAGIIKPNRLAVVSHNQKSVYETIHNLCGARSQIFFVEQLATGKILDIKPHTMKLLFSTIERGEYNIETTLIGEHQFDNILASIITAELLKEYNKITKDTIIEGVKKVRSNTGLYGRFEIIKENPPIIIDVAHNPDAVGSTVKLIGKIYPNLKWNVVFNAMKDKKYKKMLSILVPITNLFLFPNLKYERANLNSELAKTIYEIKKETETTENFPETLLFDSTIDALEYVHLNRHPTLIIGSFYLLSESVNWLKEKFLWDYPVQNENFILI